MQKYHPDKVEPLLEKYPVKEHERERRKLLLEYNMIYEATKVLTNEDKRKMYDIECKTIKNRDFIQQRASFKGFIKEQEQNMSASTKDLSRMKFIEANEEFNKKHNINKLDMNTPILNKQETDKKLTNLKTQRETQDLELLQNNLFENKKFNISDFNKKWDINHLKEKKKVSNVDKTLIKWDGISASNDSGLNGSASYASLENGYEDLYANNNIYNSTNFASVISSSSSSNSNSNSNSNLNSNSDTSDDNCIEDDVIDINMDNIKLPKNDTNNLMKRMNEFKETRNSDLQIQTGTKLSDNSYWKNINANPMNISSQMENIVGNDKLLNSVKLQKNKYNTKINSRISKDKLIAYQSLIKSDTSD